MDHPYPLDQIALKLLQEYLRQDEQYFHHLLTWIASYQQLLVILDIEEFRFSHFYFILMVESLKQLLNGLINLRP